MSAILHADLHVAYIQSLNSVSRLQLARAVVVLVGLTGVPLTPRPARGPRLPSDGSPAPQWDLLGPHGALHHGQGGRTGQEGHGRLGQVVLGRQGW